MKVLYLKTSFLFLLFFQQILFADFHYEIIGGKKAEQGQFPWMVYLTYENQPGEADCGGVLIEKNKVLTAAHCIEGNQNAITAGRVKRSQSDVGQVVKIKSITPHRNYNEETADYDVATIILESDVVGIEPIKLYQHTNQLKEGTPLVTMGWGLTTPPSYRSSWSSQYVIDRKSSNTDIPDDLMYVEVPFKEHNACKRAMSPRNITERMFCAGLDNGGRDACQNDSGGPIVTKHNGEWQLVGLVSWGDGCAEAGKYGVYTNLSVTGYPDSN